jgi:hypothetical protein
MSASASRLVMPKGDYWMLIWAVASLNNVSPAAVAANLADSAP